MWLSDYFLGKYVKEQQEKYDGTVQEVEVEPMSASPKAVKNHEEVEKRFNKFLESKQDKAKAISETSYFKIISSQAHKEVLTSDKTQSKGMSVSLSK